MTSLGVGELLIQAVDRDGKANGFDIDLIHKIESVSSLPLIALAGAGSSKHFTDVLTQTNVNAAAAANIFHFKEMIDRHIKRDLLRAGVNVRVL